MDRICGTRRISTFYSAHWRCLRWRRGNAYSHGNGCATDGYGSAANSYGGAANSYGHSDAYAHEDALTDTFAYAESSVWQYTLCQLDS